MTLHDQASELLRAVAGSDAQFRPGQFGAIEALVARRQRALVVQRTGWGKSAVYFISARLLRDAGAGMAVVISPLIALMRNQRQMAARARLNALTYNSELDRDARAAAEAQLAAGEVDVLFVTPETLTSARQNILQFLADPVALVVVDEVHCISEWGHDFRPKYRRLKGVIDNLAPGVPVLGTTATATSRVIEDIVDQLGADLQVIRGPLARDSLALHVAEIPRAAGRLAWLEQFLRRFEGTGIVYCLTVADTRLVAGWLRARGFAAVAYSASETPEAREQVERQLLENTVKVVCATSALGMGFDKPDLAFVVHFQTPGSAVAYYQQVGRAGRALPSAVGVLLRGVEDDRIIDWFIDTAFPSEPDARDVLRLLERQDGPLDTNRILTEVNVRAMRLDAMLRILEDEGVVQNVNDETGRGWVRTVKPWSYPRERVDRVAAARRREHEALIEYARVERCLMQQLQGQLDDDASGPCGRCGHCAGPLDIGVVEPAAVADAERFVWSQWDVIQPRQLWPSGMDDVRGSIPRELRPEVGRVLGRHDDGGWGSLSIAARAAGRVDERVLVALVDLVAQWDPQPAPTWLTVVPSRSADEFVLDLATRLAEALGLPFEPMLVKADGVARQNTMQNSQQQVRNVLNAYKVTGRVRAEPVLLVDDAVDSRWTLTVVAGHLRLAGAGPVHPIALVDMAGGSS